MSDLSLALSLHQEVCSKLQGPLPVPVPVASLPVNDLPLSLAEPALEPVDTSSSIGATAYIPPEPTASTILTQDAEVLHPQINQLIVSFLKYLKEPRYQAPLTIDELSKLFKYFNTDLNTLAVSIFTQLKSTKKKLILSCDTFRENETTFDYLLAISNFLASTVKLTKRTDLEALFQLRVFNYFKFITIFESIEAAQRKLFGPSSASTSNASSALVPPTSSTSASPFLNAPTTTSTSSAGDEETSLYDKIFRFDQKDIIFQEFLDEKLTALKSLSLPLSCFVEGESHPLMKVFNPNTIPDLEINQLFLDLNKLTTPNAKANQIMKIQKLFIQNIADLAFKGDTTSVNNDVLLPALIYYIIHFLPPFEEVELHLNFSFMKRFLNSIPVDNIDMNQVPQTSSVFAYVPSDKLKLRVFQRRNGKSGSLFEFLNLDEKQETYQVEDKRPDEIFASNHNTIAYIQSKFLNSGELMYYLTNFEAVLFFLLNITLEDLHQPLQDNKNELLNTSLNNLVDSELSNHFKFPAGEAILEPQSPEAMPSVQLPAPAQTSTSLELVPMAVSASNGGRSRSSSLFNTISNNFKDSVHRSRSNSSIMNNAKPNNTFQKETFPSILSSSVGSGAVSSSAASGGSGDSDSLQTSPVNSNENPPSSVFTDGGSSTSQSSMVIMKNILGRIGQVLVPQLGLPPNSSSSVGTVVGASEETHAIRKHANTSPLRSPNTSRTRSSSIEQKRNSITSKFTSGVSEFMTKINNVNTNTSSLSLHSLDNNPEDTSAEAHHNGTSTESPARRPEYNRARTTSLQIMDKWFSNITNNMNAGVTHVGTTATTHQPNSSIPFLGKTNEATEVPSHLFELTKYQNTDFELLTISDLKQLKANYDKLCGIVNIPMVLKPNAPASHFAATGTADIHEQASFSEETSI